MDTIFQKVMDYIGNLPPWQQEAARRLKQKPEGLTDADFQDLVTLVLWENGLCDEHKRVDFLVAEPPQQSMSDRHAILLKSLGQLKHVNRIDPAAILQFAPQGMTIVYGHNGTGKSGYARVIKKACNVRGPSESILPDVTDAQAGGNTSSAVFEIDIGETIQKVVWDGNMPHGCPELASVSVFDSSTAHLIVATERELRYVPRGLEILEHLARDVIPTVKEKLGEMAHSIVLDERPFVGLQGEHAVGKIFARLHDASLESIKALGTLDERATLRKQELENLLTGTHAEENLKRVRQTLNRAEEIFSVIAGVNSQISDRIVSEFHTDWSAFKAAQKAAEIAKQELTQDESLLTGTGGEAWKQLFFAAQTFIAETTESTLHVSEMQKCPLCQRPLDETTRQRIKRFEAYLQDTTAHALAETQQKLERCQANTRQVNPGNCFSAITRDEFSELSERFSQAHQQWVESIEKRKKSVLDALEGAQDWLNIPSIDMTIITELEAIKQQLAGKVVSLEKMMSDEGRKAAEAELRELQAQFLLQALLPQVEKWFEEKNRQRRLLEIASQLSSLDVTKKAKELSSQSVTKPLIAAITEELKKLRLTELPTHPVFATKGKRGQLFGYFKLDVPHSASPMEVFSEGERQALAIAAFLGELDVSGHSNPVVFDDPMTSLDYFRKREIADRLVEEATRRQVVIFSHEPFFVSRLLDKCEEQHVPCALHSLSAEGKTTGHVSPGASWELKKHTERIDELEKRQSALRKAIVGYPTKEQNAEIKHCYALLRETVETVVQNVCLNGVVRRFSSYVNVKNMLQILPLSANALDKLYGIYTKCSGYLPGHDHSVEADEAPPTVGELGDDIHTLRDIVEEIRQARNDARKGKSSCREKKAEG